MKIAITGGIGSGKSQVLKIIKSFGFVTVSADEISKNLTSTNEILSGLKKIFPDCVDSLNGNLYLNKTKLSSAVFNNKQNLKKLNDYLHPLIMKEVFNEIGENGFAEIPLLFECGFENLFDKVIVVLRNKKDRIAAVKLRNGLSDKQVLERMKNQIDYDCFDFSKYIIIKNDGSIEDLKEKTVKIISELDVKV